MNNEYRALKKSKDKKSLIKIRSAKSFSFINESARKAISYKFNEAHKFIESSKSCETISVKENDLLTETCFIYHKSNHTSRDCSDKFNVNALNDEFDRSDFESDFDFDSKN